MLSIIGLIFRRCWGGWHVPPHIMKVLLGFVLSIFMAFLFIPNLYGALCFGTIIGFSFLNPFHSWGMGMGYDKPGKSTIVCAIVMGGSYGAFTTSAFLAQLYFTHDWSFIWYALTGFLTPVAYVIAWKWAISRGYIVNGKEVPSTMQFLNIFGEWFIDSPTAIGECFLGALLLSLCGKLYV